ncbi:MAG: glycosyltransferase family 2 protein, partial [Oscillospiraceae bacterium]
MTSTPLVSVIMPVYNGEKYLKKAIASVAVQELPLELITIDDCSQDNSAAIIASCRDDYPNMEFVHITNEKNMGVAKSRNAGVRVARAPYIAFLDCDDWWEPGKLSAQLSRMEKSCRVLSCTAREFVEDNGAPTGRIVPVSEIITYGQLLKFNS